MSFSGGAKRRPEKLRNEMPGASPGMTACAHAAFDFGRTASE